MALSKQVEESLKSAEDNLREALAFAARSERPYLIREIGAMVSQIENLINVDDMFDRLDNAIDEQKKKTASDDEGV
tara:strand:+ start:6984 stop:7211 length:228 start_codon:yes stop_codon:yes gene_type:complete